MGASRAVDYEGMSTILLKWFAVHQRPLPWRESYSPYHVWISEIMLQQTQMERVVDYFCRWVEIFPDLTSVALAEEDRVLKLWEGLGYYSRARNLHKTARLLVGERQGLFPRTKQELLALPGIGEYTAAAVASLITEDENPEVFWLCAKAHVFGHARIA